MCTQPRAIVLAVDDSVHSSHALSWVLSHLVAPGDELHCVCVALPVPYPVSQEVHIVTSKCYVFKWESKKGRWVPRAMSCTASALRCLCPTR